MKHFKPLKELTTTTEEKYTKFKTEEQFQETVKKIDKPMYNLIKMKNEPTIQDFVKWAELNSNNPSHYTTLKEFVDGVKNGDLVKCAVCGVYELQEHMTEARFSIYEEVCPECERNGN